VVAEAPSLLGDRSDAVSHVIVSRRRLDDDRPARILVHASAGDVEAADDRAIIATR
jgi:hypothetical protein